jgi:TetR/AcrR family transcriptional regulator, cholesterol catabolism regulator
MRWGAAESVDERKDEILRELGAAVRERGFGALTMKDVADRLGLVKGNLYYYFKNKQELLYHCHIKCMEVSLKALEEAERSRAAPSERLRTLLVRHIRGISDEAYGAVLLTDLESLTLAQRRKYVALRDRFEQGVRALIKAGIARGEFRRLDSRIVGFALLGAINWIPKWYRPGGELSSQEIAEQFADFFLRSLYA